MPTFLLGILALVVVMLALPAFARANPTTLARNLRAGAGVAAMGGAFFMLWRGVASLALPLAAVGFWLLAGKGAGSWHWPQRGGTVGGAARTSRVVTEHLEMELDHDSGRMEGRVLKGFFAGRALSDMRPVELAHLWQDCRFVDPQSAQLVEAYLDRVHPPWREDMSRQESETPKGPDGRMTREEALEILGLQAGPTEEQIRAAHRALMLKLHPDRGGSTYLAAKINEAKDVLLGP